jgi:hypothetical protein
MFDDVPSMRDRMRATGRFLPFHRWMFSALVFKDQQSLDAFCAKKLDEFNKRYQ